MEEPAEYSVPPVSTSQSTSCLFYCVCDWYKWSTDFSEGAETTLMNGSPFVLTVSSVSLHVFFTNVRQDLVGLSGLSLIT